MHIPTIAPPARGVLPSAIGFNNCAVVGLADDVSAKYDWLKSSDRNARMGALSATNRRTLILAPGTYTLAAQWDLDTDYVDVVSLTGNPADTIVTASAVIFSTSTTWMSAMWVSTCLTFAAMEFRLL